jgi:DNA-binding NarL/FixJ family response regulator
MERQIPSPGGTILIADDHPLFRQAIAMAAERAAPGCRIVEAATLEDATARAATIVDLRLILLDLKMPGATGFSGVAMLHAERPDVPVLVVSSAEGQTVPAEARRFGAVGFIGKDQDLDMMERAIADAVAGKPMPAPTADETGNEIDEMAGKVAQLTPTQLRVLLGVLDGRLNKQIAYDLSITEATVKAHMTAVMAKLGVQNRTQAALAARALGIGAPPP